jgi:hypothetical protein
MRGNTNERTWKDYLLKDVGRICHPLYCIIQHTRAMHLSRLPHGHICESHILSRYPGFFNVPHLFTRMERYLNMCPIKSTNVIFQVWKCSSIICYPFMNGSEIDIFWNNETFCHCHHTLQNLTKFSTNDFTGVIKMILGPPIRPIPETYKQENCKSLIGVHMHGWL